jgi:hypothetical protein
MPTDILSKNAVGTQGKSAAIAKFAGGPRGNHRYAQPNLANAPIAAAVVLPALEPTHPQRKPPTDWLAATVANGRQSCTARLMP